MHQKTTSTSTSDIYCSLLFLCRCGRQITQVSGKLCTSLNVNYCAPFTSSWRSHSITFCWTNILSLPDWHTGQNCWEASTRLQSLLNMETYRDQNTQRQTDTLSSCKGHREQCNVISFGQWTHEESDPHGPGSPARLLVLFVCCCAASGLRGVYHNNFIYTDL